MNDLFSEQLEGSLPELSRLAGLANLEKFFNKAGGAYAKGET